MNFKVKKLKPSRIFQNVVSQVEEAILKGDLKPGDVLPPEMKLKEMFETSRGTIREALRVLEEKGLVDIKTGVGGGAIVRNLGTEKVAESLNLLIQTQSLDYDCLAEFREDVEGRVAYLAAKRAKEEDIGRLKSILENAEEVRRNSPKRRDFLRLDIEFHVALAEITGNPLYVVVVKMIHDTVMGYSDPYSRSFAETENMEDNLKDLKCLIDAIISKDADMAKCLAEEHIRKFNKRMKEKVGSPG